MCSGAYADAPRCAISCFLAGGWSRHGAGGQPEQHDAGENTSQGGHHRHCTAQREQPCSRPAHARRPILARGGGRVKLVSSRASFRLPASRLLEPRVPSPVCEAPRCILTGAMLGNANEILHAPPVTIGSDPRVDAEYKRLRRQVFAGIFIGYAGVLPGPQQPGARHPRHPARAPGVLARRSSASALTGAVDCLRRLEVPDGLGLRSQQSRSTSCRSACCSRARSWPRSGSVKAIYGSLALIIVLQTVNGWVQGMGWPPCGKTMVHWFSTKERGLVVSTWNVVAQRRRRAGREPSRCSASTLFDDWGAKFYFNALIAAAVAVVVVLPAARHAAVVRPAADRGLPERLSAATTAPTTSGPSPIREIFFEHVLHEPLPVGDRVRQRVRLLRALRRGELDPDLPRDREGLLVPAVEHRLVALRVRGHSRARSPAAGCRIAVFKGRRAPATILFMALTLVAVDRLLAEPARAAVDRLRGAHRDRLPDLRPDHDHRPARARPRAEEGGRHGRRVHRLLRLRVRLGDRRAPASAGSPTTGAGTASSSRWSPAACWPSASAR